MVSESPTAESRTRRETRGEPAWLLCRVCEHRIVPTSSAVSFDGAHRHRFTNPGQLTFEIGLYDEAPGCLHQGEASEYWSWFPGYAWRVAVCAGCRSHLGWAFQCVGTPGLGEPPDFHGLILDRLRAAG